MIFFKVLLAVVLTLVAFSLWGSMTQEPIEEAPFEIAT